MAAFSYHNDGHAYVMVEPDWPVRDGHVVFAAPPSVEQLRAAFPGHAAKALIVAARDALGAGLTIELTGEATLDPTAFPTDDGTRVSLADIATVIALTGGFPGGADTVPMRDTAGEWHAFTLPEWKSIAAAIVSYAAALRLIADGNPLGVTELPPARVSLTVPACKELL